MNYVYLVLFNWTTEDDGELESYVYSNYADAVKKFKSIIADEMDPALSWVGDEAFNSAGEINKGFVLLEFTDDSKGADLYWQVADYNESNRYSYITLRKKEIL